MPRLAPFALAAAIGLAACAPPAPEAASARTHLTATATLLAADADTRLLTLRDPATGATFAVTAAAEAGELAGIRPGDVIMVDYLASTTFAPAPPGTGPEPLSVAGDAPSPIGSRPGGVSVGATSAVVEFLGLDGGHAMLRGADGIARRVPVPPPLAAFAARLAPGDRMLVTVTEAVALSVTPAPG